MRFIDGAGALAAEMRLKIGHEQSGGDTLAGNIADDETEAIVTEMQVIVVITTDVASGKTNATEFQSWERG